ncbi:MAG: threonine synthase, partial [Alphaproteobacteria bacterium]|nr:threonine synthase [Alphaproteobacteria bacterium]
GDSEQVTALMTQFRETGSFALDRALTTRAQADFTAARCSEDDTLTTMRECYAATGYLIDPHTAVGLHAAQQQHKDPAIPVVIPATAHPAKFPAAVKQAVGFEPSVPERLAAALAGEERFTVLPKDLDHVKNFVKEHAGK